jgi:hypothetical protein
MAVGGNYTSLDAAFKQYYADGIEDLTIKDRPLFGLLPKHEGWVGANQATRAWHVPLKFALPPAVSANFTVAQGRAATTSSKVVAWELQSKQMYAFIQIDNESIERSKNDVGAFVEVRSLETDGIIQNVSNRLHHYSYLDGTGALAQVGTAAQQASFATSVLQLASSEDAIKFAYGDELVVASSNTAATRALGANGHGLYVIGTNYDKGTLTVGTAAGAAVNLNDANDGIPTIANGDSIFHRGDAQNGTGIPAVVQGFTSWIPQTAPVNGDSQANVDRSQNVDFLAGSRYDGSSVPIEEALVRGTNVVAKKGGTLEQIFLNHKHYSDLVSGLSAKGIVNFLDIRPNDYPSIGFEGVKIIGAKGEVDIIPDYACPSNLAAGFDLSDWYFASVGEPVSIMNGDGLQFLRLGAADGLEMRVYSYSNVVPRNPRNAINITLPL